MTTGSDHAALAAYLRHRVREAVREEGGKPFAKRASVNHPAIYAIRDGRHLLTDAGTNEKLARAFGLDMRRLYDEALRFAREHPDLVALEGGEVRERTTHDAPDAPSFGALPGWNDAEARARRRWPHIPDEAWAGARSLAGATFPRTVTAEFVRRAAELWLEGHSAPELDED